MKRNLATRVAVGVTSVLISVAGLTGCAFLDSSDDPGNENSSLQDQPTEVFAVDGALTVDLVASESMVPFADGERWAMTYNGEVTGPTLRVHPGDTLTINLTNQLSEPTSIHTHGLHVSPLEDNPFVEVGPGEIHTFTYTIPTDHPNGTFWYHPHVHGLTANQVASGLSGAIVIDDGSDSHFDAAVTDRVLVLTDPLITQSNPWGGGSGGAMSGMDHGGSSGVDMMTAMMGRTGDALLTNGLSGVFLADSGGKVERVRVVNSTASSRILLTLPGGTMTEIAVDGGRLETGYTSDPVELAPGDRTELILLPGSGDGQLFAQRLDNESVANPIDDPTLIADLPQNASNDNSVLPAPIDPMRDLFAIPADANRTIHLVGHMNPTFDGVPFDMNAVNYEAQLGTVEEWTIVNDTPMVHPIHLHTWPFQIEGEAGWHDVVTVRPQSTIVIRVSFDDYAGTTVLHCHILDHEDGGMMATIRIQ